jgi:ABC-type multidrug transport system ATPase subunit
MPSGEPRETLQWPGGPGQGQKAFHPAPAVPDGPPRMREPARPESAAGAGEQRAAAGLEPHLDVTFRDPSSSRTERHLLERPEMTLGSDPVSDIVINSPTIPPRFAVIEQRRGAPPRLLVREPGATLVYQGKAVREHELRPGDTLWTGDPNGAYITLRYDERPPDSPIRPARARWRIPLTPDTPLTIGSALDNQLVLNDEAVAPHHARIWRNEAGQFQLSDLTRAQATYLNGIAVESAALAPGAEVRIGPYRLIFTGTELLRYDEASDVRIDAVDVREWTRAGGLRVLSGERKILLDGVSLTILPGTFVAIIGASGAGKTTLLNILNGQQEPSAGEALYNGDNIYAHEERYRDKLAFVPQDDIIHKNLTVERALTYAARLRLPEHTRRSEIRERVRETLEDVDMLPQRGQLISHLSGGQRKRVNIAMELLGRPAVFFLDEPSAGLDPGLDRKLMELLRRLADRGKSVVLVTHETSNIKLCDFVCFIAPGGRLAYYGAPSEMKAHFGTADHAEIYTMIDSDPERWVQLFRQSPDYLKYIEGPRLQSVSRSMAATDASAATSQPRKHGAFRQFTLLTTRYLDLMAHDPVNLLILLIQAPIIAGLIILLADQNAIQYVLQPPAAVQNYDILAQRTVFIMVCSALWFGAINSAREIVKEAPIYRREHAVGLRVGSYVLSKVVVLGALCAVQDAILLFLVGLKAGYPPHGIIWPGVTGAFIELYLTLLLTGLAGLMIGLTVSALAPNTDRAVSFVPIILIPQIIFANVIFSLSDDVSKIISYLMPSRWGMQAAGSIVGIRDRFSDHANTPFYSPDTLHLLGFWLALVGLIALFFTLTALLQARKR